MADNYLNKTGLKYFYDRIKTVFALKSDVPTSTSDITNNGDGDSPFATESYVTENGGKIDVIKVNGTAQPIANKEVNITVPTAVSALTNDSDYQTASQVGALIEDAIGDITGLSYEVVSALPATGNAGTIYLVANSGSAPNIYDEYIFVSNSWEKIGTTETDLSQYWSQSELAAITTAEIDTITA